jgi:hypothetical protein
MRWRLFTISCTDARSSSCQVTAAELLSKMAPVRMQKNRSSDKIFDLIHFFFFFYLHFFFLTVFMFVQTCTSILLLPPAANSNTFESHSSLAIRMYRRLSEYTDKLLISALHK